MQEPKTKALLALVVILAVVGNYAMGVLYVDGVSRIHPGNDALLLAFISVSWAWGAIACLAAAELYRSIRS